MDFLNNICLLTDSYKASHYKQYPPNTEKVYSYFESRGGKFPNSIFFGLQYYLKEYLSGQVVTAEKIAQARKLWNLHFGRDVFNVKGWEYILDSHNGRLPVEIKAVPEGTVVGNHNVLMTIENTDPNCYWLPNYLETLLVQVWYGTTVATQSWEMKKIILEYLNKTGNPDEIDFKLHDFGFRGVTSVESAAMGAAAHLVNFKGTDTAVGLILAKEYYNEEMAGFSIPASEHSTITSWGSDGELDAMRNMLRQYPEGPVACVSDSFDIFRACREYWGGELKEEILNRDGTLIVRPDSGELPGTVLKVLEILGEQFGTEMNDKGYRVLNQKVRVIQGDGIDFDSLGDILTAVTANGWSADNIAFGSGGGLLQKLNRDTLKFAFKCSSVTVNGEERDVFKQPVTDPGKNSKRGRFQLIQEEGVFKTVSTADSDYLQTVFLNGNLPLTQNFSEIRKRAGSQLA